MESTHTTSDTAGNQTTVTPDNSNNVTTAGVAKDYTFTGYVTNEDKTTHLYHMMTDLFSTISPIDDMVDNITSDFAATNYNSTIPMEYDTTSVAMEMGAGGAPVYEPSVYMTTANYMRKYIFPVIVIVGVLGNSLTFYVLSTRNTIRKSCVLILQVLMVTDTLCLLVSLLRYCLLAQIQWEIRDVSNIVCKLHVFFTYFISEYSSWILVVITISTTISVLSPLKSDTLCSRRRMGLALVIVAICLLPFSLQILFTVDLRIRPELPMLPMATCYYADGYAHFYMDIWPWMDFCLYALAPQFIILIGNVITLTQLWKAERRRSKLTNSDSKKACKCVSSVAAMLLSRTITFFLLIFPLSVFLIGVQKWQKSRDPVYHEKLFLFHTVCVMLGYTTNAINFFLYCASGPQFRKALRQMFTCTCNATLQQDDKWKWQPAAKVTDNSQTLDSSQTLDTSICSDKNLTTSSKKSDQISQTNKCNSINSRSTIKSDGTEGESGKNQQADSNGIENPAYISDELNKYIQQTEHPVQDQNSNSGDSGVNSITMDDELKENIKSSFIQNELNQITVNNDGESTKL